MSKTTIFFGMKEHFYHPSNKRKLVNFITYLLVTVRQHDLAESFAWRTIDQLKCGRI